MKRAYGRLYLLVSGESFFLEDFENVLVRKKRATPPTPKLLDEAAEEKLIALFSATINQRDEKPARHGLSE